MEQKEQEGALSCDTNINRLDTGPDNWRAVLGSGAQYQDPDFAPGPDALFWNTHLRPGSGDVVAAYRGVTEWKRPSELIAKGQNLSLWGDSGIALDAVGQGKLGDGWFLSAAAALAAVPKRVKKLFIFEKYP